MERTTERTTRRTLINTTAVSSIRQRRTSGHYQAGLGSRKVPQSSQGSNGLTKGKSSSQASLLSRHQRDPCKPSRVVPGLRLTPPIPPLHDSTTINVDGSQWTQSQRILYPLEEAQFSHGGLVHADGFGRRVDGLGTPAMDLEMSESSNHSMGIGFEPEFPGFESDTPPSFIPEASRSLRHALAHGQPFTGAGSSSDTIDELGTPDEVDHDSQEPFSKTVVPDSHRVLLDTPHGEDTPTREIMNLLLGKGPGVNSSTVHSVHPSSDASMGPCEVERMDDPEASEGDTYLRGIRGRAASQKRVVHDDDDDMISSSGMADAVPVGNALISGRSRNERQQRSRRRLLRDDGGASAREETPNLARDDGGAPAREETPNLARDDRGAPAREETQNVVRDDRGALAREETPNVVRDDVGPPAREETPNVDHSQTENGQNVSHDDIVPEGDHVPPHTSTSNRAIFSGRLHVSQLTEEEKLKKAEYERLRKREWRAQKRSMETIIKARVGSGSISLASKPRLLLFKGLPYSQSHVTLVRELSKLVRTELKSFRYAQSITKEEHQKLHNLLHGKYENGHELLPEWTRLHVSNVLRSWRTSVRTLVQKQLRTLPANTQNPTPPVGVSEEEMVEFTKQLGDPIFLAASTQKKALARDMVKKRGCGNPMGTGGVNRANTHYILKDGKVPSIEEVQKWKDAAYATYSQNRNGSTHSNNAQAGASPSTNIEDMDPNWNHPFHGPKAFFDRYVLLYDKDPTDAEISSWLTNGRPPLHHS